jgi:hypothetical protein
MGHIGLVPYPDPLLSPKDVPGIPPPCLYGHAGAGVAGRRSPLPRQQRRQ